MYDFHIWSNFWYNLVNTMAADAPASWVATSSVTMLSTLHDTQIPIFHKEGFQLPASSQCRGMIEKYI